MAERRVRTAIALLWAFALTAGTVAAEPRGRDPVARGDHAAGPAWRAPGDEAAAGGQGRERGAAQQRARAEPGGRGSRGQEFRERERTERRASDERQVRRAERSRPGDAAPARRWEDLSPGERQRLQQRERSFQALPGDQQQRLRQAEARYRSMSPEQREELRRRWEGLSEGERDRYRRRVEQRGD